MSHAFTNFPGMVAGATIAPKRLLKLSTSAEFTLIHNAAATTACIAVSGEGQKVAPGLPGADSAVHAEAGDQLLDILGPGNVVKLVAGSGGVTKGANVESDSVGLGVIPSGAGEHCIAGQALTAAAEGEDFYLFFIPQQITIAA